MPGQNNKTPRVEQISYLLWSNNAKKFPKYIQKIVNKKGFDEKRPDASEIEFQRYSDIVLYTKLSEIRKEMPVADNDIICFLTVVDENGNETTSYHELPSRNIETVLHPIIGTDVAKCEEHRTITWGANRHQNLIGLIDDGNTHYRATYRVFKTGVDDKRKQIFKKAFYEGTLTDAEISRYTDNLGKHARQNRKMR